MSNLSRRQRLLRRWLAILMIMLPLLAILAWLSSIDHDPYRAADAAATGVSHGLDRSVDADSATLRFDDVTTRAGLRFRHFPATRRSLLPEDMGSGVAWGDYDNDGHIDLFLVNFRGSIVDGGEGRCALFRNNGDGSFSDVSRDSGLDLSIHGMGAAWADYDNDGRLDLYISAYGDENVLMRNIDNGRFVDVTAAAGVGDAGFGAGVAWADYDGDGWLDLYLANYVEFEWQPHDLQRSQTQYDTEVPYTLNPSSYQPAENRLFRNLGDGRFVELAGQLGVANPNGRSMQPVWFDFNNDGRIDLYVANDVSDNAVYLNTVDGFEDIGARSLAADYRGAMGLAVADYNHDGLQDLFITHWLAQENVLFENMTDFDDPAGPRVLFMEVGERLGLGYSSLRQVGWATGFADFDNDGRTDLWIGNGHTLPQAERVELLIAQTPQIYRNIERQGYVDVTPQAWPDAGERVVRGGAQADFDGDGKLDLLLMQHGDAPILLRNLTPVAGRWLALRLRQSGCNTHAIGARVELRTTAGLRSAQVMAGGSYLSQNSSDLHFGLAADESVDAITIHWPDGHPETITQPPLDQLLVRNHPAKYPDCR